MATKPNPAPRRRNDGTELPVRRAKPYKPEYSEKLVAAIGAGFTITEISRYFGVDTDTVNLWIMIYPEFAAAVRATSAIRNDRVEAALYQRAVGYDVLGEKIVVVDRTKIKRVKIYTHIPADPLAAKAWLEKKSPGTWAPKAENDGDSKQIVVYGGIPPDEPGEGSE